MKQINNIEEYFKKFKPYLYENNYTPNLGNYNFSKNLSSILNGSIIYRNKIYGYDKNDLPIKNLGGGDPIQQKIFNPTKKYINKVLKTSKINIYPHTIGDKEYKEEVIKYLLSIGIYNINQENVIFTESTTHGYYNILKSIIRHGDVVIVPLPTYGLFSFFPERFGGIVKTINLDELNNFKLNLKELEIMIDDINNNLLKVKKYDYIPRVVAIYNQNPNNPTGNVIDIDSKKYLNSLNELCYKKGVLIIDDLVYRDLTFNQNKLPFPMMALNKHKSNIVSLFGISKSYSLAGIRAGFVVGNKYLIEDIRDNIFQTMDSVSIIGQAAVASIFNNNKIIQFQKRIYLNKLLKKYKFNFDIIKYFVNGEDGISKFNLIRIKCKVIKKFGCQLSNGMANVSIYRNSIPDSGFFVLLNFTNLKGKKISNVLITNEESLLIALFKASKIKFLPGSSFGWINNKEIMGRITFSLKSKYLIDYMGNLYKIVNSISKEEEK